MNCVYIYTCLATFIIKYTSWTHFINIFVIKMYKNCIPNSCILWTFAFFLTFHDIQNLFSTSFIQSTLHNTHKHFTLIQVKSWQSMKKKDIKFDSLLWKTKQRRILHRKEESRVELMPGIKGEGDIWYRSILYPTQAVSACRNPIAQVLVRAVLSRNGNVSETCRW